MKKIFLLTATFVAVMAAGLFTSCSGNEDAAFMNQEKELFVSHETSSDVVTIDLLADEQSESENHTVSFVRKICGTISYDSLLIIGQSRFVEWESSPEYPTGDRGTESHTVTSFHDYTYIGSYKVLIPQEMATILNIPTQYYVIDVFTFYYYLNIPGLGVTKYFVSDNSPNCGLNPVASNTIGYSSSVVGNNVTMASNGFLINSSLSGIVYNIWFPRNPALFQWNYKLVDIE